MTKLDVKINKRETMRNARGGNMPDVVKFAIDCESFGAQGITVHPRPDERHIKYRDVLDLRPVIKTEFNIEGNPIKSFKELVLKVRPTQVTLVPDAHDAVTSNAGWNTIDNLSFLTDIIEEFQHAGIRTSIFVDADEEMIRYAAKTGTDRIELYTEPYAAQYEEDREKAVEPFAKAAKLAHQLGLGVNAGHDLNLENLKYFYDNVPFLDEVSIGHALVSDALYLGIEETIRRYKECLK